MSEIWNLGALCRCCHADGIFKSLNLPFMSQNQVEVYANILHDTFGISIEPPPFEASYAICDDCIERLQDAKLFKDQILECERKFLEYCQNELANNPTVCIKTEESDDDNAAENSTNDIPEPVDDKTTLSITYEAPDIKSDVSDDNGIHHDVTTDNIKKEVTDSSPAKKDETPEKKPPVKKKLLKRKVKTEKGAPVAKVARTNKQKCTKTRRKKPPVTNLIVQIKTEKGDIFSCKDCGGTYNDLKELKQHLKNHKKTTVTCDHCQMVFSTKYTLQKHIRVKHDSRPKRFKCDRCEHTLSTKPGLIRHINSHHTKSQVFTCDVCKTDFYDKSTLRRHLMWHKGIKPFICETCGLRASDSTTLRIHIEVVHDKIRKYICNVCGKPYSTNKALKYHMLRHTGKNPLKCNKCQRQFYTTPALERHLNNHEYNLTKTYQCKVCPFTFSHRGKFKAHVRSHQGSLPYKCHLCSKDFSCKYSLNRHVIDHSGIKRYFCEICHTGFIQKPALKRHMDRVHDPTKATKVRVKCDLCKQNVNDLEKHKEKHFNRPHMCNVCNKSYPTTSSLNRHVRIEHLNVRNHQCDQCSKAYTRSDALKNHKKNKHKLELKMEQNFDVDIEAFTVRG